MEKKRVLGNEYRSTLICVDSYRNGVPEGRFYNPGLPGGAGFSSLSQLLIRMDEMLEEMRFPQAYTMLRSFSDPAETPAPDAVLNAAPHVGKAATFAVRVLFRQNASWQGTVLWQEGKKEESFRSVLELIFLMDSALRKEQ